MRWPKIMSLWLLIRCWLWLVMFRLQAGDDCTPHDLVGHHSVRYRVSRYSLVRYQFVHPEQRCVQLLEETNELYSTWLGN